MWQPEELALGKIQDVLPFFVHGNSRLINVNSYKVGEKRKSRLLISKWQNCGKLFSMSKRDGPKQKPRPSKQVLDMILEAKANRKRNKATPKSEDFSPAVVRISGESTQKK
jgi:hypothetical protein